MICKYCGSILREGAVTCDQCGEAVSVRASGGSGRRQGRPEQAADERGTRSRYRERSAAEGSSREDVGRMDTARGASAMPVEGQKPTRASHRSKKSGTKKVMVNWALVATIAAALLILSLAGGYVFLKITDQGQLILARMGREANATAMWAYGEELLDQGYIERAIAQFKAAREKEPQREDMYQKLQLLADAYEAGGHIAEAEQTYRDMCQLDEKNVSAYYSIARILEDQNRRMELANFLKTAYEKTGDTAFRRQREDLLPSTPTSDTEAGSLMLSRDVTLLSKEDYDIYYILGEEGELPEDGTLFTEPIHLDEGVHVLRAVAVSNDLVSDEMNLKYIINLPVPSAPYPNLAPGTYERKQWVSLKYLVSDEEKMAMDPKRLDITIYYTIDGQTPSSNSPIYDGTPIELPGGRVTLKAVAVNGYGKVSNVLERKFKINNVSKKTFFSDKDAFSDFALLKTTRDEFVRQYGTPDSEQEIQDDSVRGNCIELTYGWGRARFNMTAAGYTLYDVDTGSNSMVGPRKTRIGMREQDVTDLFQDIGQPHDQNGDRSLYWDDATRSTGKVYRLDDIHDRILYTYPHPDEGIVSLYYELENGRVTRMGMKYTIK